MTKIRSFRAVRPQKDKVSSIVSTSINLYKPDEINHVLDQNPHSFLNIVYPEGYTDEVQNAKSNNFDRFKKVKRKYEDFKEQGLFVQDANASFYIYRQTKKGHMFLGIIAGADISDYNNNHIKKHEDTLPARKALFIDYLDTVGFNAEPVLLSHPKHNAVDAILKSIIQRTPEYNFATSDAIEHELWLANAEEVAQITSIFEDIKTLYIADGHHRSASSVELAERRKANNHYDPNKNYNAFLSFLISEDQLRILPFNRLCKSLNNLTKDSFFEKLSKHFIIEELNEPSEPKQQHVMHMYLDKKWFSLQVKIDTISTKTTIDLIDAEILTNYILSPVLGIKDLTLSNDISFISGEEGVKGIQESVDSGDYQVGFALHAVNIEQFKAVADQGEIMPVKSTWIEPKLKLGLTIYPTDE